LARAIDQRAVRPDVKLDDVTTLLNAIATATQTARDTVETDALMTIVVNGIAYGGHWSTQSARRTAPTIGS
jgi:hypothetical protein